MVQEFSSLDLKSFCRLSLLENKEEEITAKRSSRRAATSNKDKQICTEQPSHLEPNSRRDGKVGETFGEAQRSYSDQLKQFKLGLIFSSQAKYWQQRSPCQDMMSFARHLSTEPFPNHWSLHQIWRPWYPTGMASCLSAGSLTFKASLKRDCKPAAVS